MNKRGFTLMELLVYMAIVGIVVVIAGQVYSDSTKMRVRTQNMLKASEIAENVGTLFREDVSQMGAKSKKNTSNGTMALETNVMMNPSDETSVIDSSSFNNVNKIVNTLHKDSLAFRRAKYDENGNFVRVEEVSWYVEGDILKRSCKTISGTSDENECNSSDNMTIVEIADGVKNFMVTPAKPGLIGSDGTLFPNYTDPLKKNFKLLPYDGESFYTKATSTPNGSMVTLSNFLSNYSTSGATVTNPTKHQFFLANETATADSWKNCEEFTFEKGKIYEIRFGMVNQNDNSRMFRPGIDHMAVGIRSTADANPTPFPDVQDFLFYPPENADGSGDRIMRFSVNSGSQDNYTACVAFTFAFFSPTVASGTFAISGLRVYEVADANYEFVDNYAPNASDRKNVRAFRLKLDVEKGKENGHVEIVVPVPSNGTKG